MCLSTVKEIYDNPSTCIVDGWKELGSTGSPRVQMAINGRYDVPLDKWVKATDEHAKSGIKASDNTIYQPGFHVYSDETEFRKKDSTMRRVFVRNITCLGTQDGKHVIIAQEMYIPSDLNGWPPKPEKKKSLLSHVKDVM